MFKTIGNPQYWRGDIFQQAFGSCYSAQSLSFRLALIKTRVIIRTWELDPRSYTLLENEYFSCIPYFLGTSKEDTGNKQRESREERRSQLQGLQCTLEGHLEAARLWIRVPLSTHFHSGRGKKGLCKQVLFLPTSIQVWGRNDSYKSKRLSLHVLELNPKICSRSHD